MNPPQIQKILKAGYIASQVREYAKKIIKKDKLLLEIVEALEAKIIELGAKPAFPTNISINEIAAHYTPAYNDETKAHGLLKIDFGVHIDGWTADTAFSIDLENNKENKELIKASEQALNAAIEAVKQNKTIGQIGKEIQETISNFGFSPIRNLSGHEIQQYDLHAGLTIPNYNTPSEKKLKEGTYAIEPFATTGQGQVYDSKNSGIYKLSDPKNPRDATAREILNYIIEEYKTLPFCSRWIVKKFGARALISLSQLEQIESLHQFKQLVEKAKGKVAQSEHTILIKNREIHITTQ